MAKVAVEITEAHGAKCPCTADATWVVLERTIETGPPPKDVQDIKVLCATCKEAEFA